MTNLTLSGATLKVAIEDLVVDPLNVRTVVSEGGIAELANSIAAEGLLQNLMVRTLENGKYAVIGGERRRRALSLLVARGDIKATDKVACKVIKSDASDASYAENTQRQAMHPVDQYRAFTSMADAGSTIAQISLRHGVSEQGVTKCLKLGRLAPAILDAFAEGVFGPSVAEAFTVVEDHALQVSTLKVLTEQSNLSAYRVTKLLAGEEANTSNKLAKLVGRDAYEAAGGEIRVDIFEADFYFKNLALLEELAQERLEAAAASLAAEGWVDVIYTLDYEHSSVEGYAPVSTVHADLSPELQKEYDELDAQTDKLLDQDTMSEEEDALFDKLTDRLDELRELQQVMPEVDKTEATHYLYVNHDGSIATRGPLLPTAAAKALEKKDSENEPPKVKGYSKALCDDLAALRLEAAKTKLLGNPKIASDLLAFHAICGTLSGYSHTNSPFVLSVKAHESSSKHGDMGEFLGRDIFENLVSDLRLDWYELEDKSESFAAFHALTSEEKTALQAYAAILMLLPSLPDGSSGYTHETLELAISMAGLEMADVWTPSADFFNRTSKQIMLDIAREVGCTESEIAEFEKMRKPEFAGQLAAMFEKSKGTGDALDKWNPKCFFPNSEKDA